MIRPAEPPPRDPQQIIDDQARESERLPEDLRCSEAERQRQRQRNLKDELEKCPERRNVRFSRE